MSQVHYVTLQSCSPGDNSSKGCLEKQREQAKSGVEAAVLILLIFQIFLKSWGTVKTNV